MSFNILIIHKIQQNYLAKIQNQTGQIRFSAKNQTKQLSISVKKSDQTIDNFRKKSDQTLLKPE
jgi:hypothetical protein